MKTVTLCEIVRSASAASPPWAWLKHHEKISRTSWTSARFQRRVYFQLKRREIRNCQHASDRERLSRVSLTRHPR